MALHYNLAKVYEVSENDTDFAFQIVRVFLEETPKDLKEIKKNIENKTYEATYSLCHKLKPNLDILGMDLAYEENIQIMNWSKTSGKRKDIIETYKLMKEHIDMAMKELRKDFKL